MREIGYYWCKLTPTGQWNIYAWSATGLFWRNGGSFYEYEFHFISKVRIKNPDEA